VVALVVGSGVLLVSLGLAAAGVAVLVADRGLRQDGYLMSGEQALTSSGYALTTDTLRLEGETPTDAVPERLLGSVRVTVTPRDKADVFVGVASATDVSRYLSNVAHTTVTELRPRAEGGPRYRETPGEAPSQQPHEADIWEASAAGPGPQSVVWAPRTGDWTVVVMHADGSRPVRADVSAGAELPVLKAAARVMLVLAVPGLLAGAGGLVLSLYRFRPSEPRARKSNGETT
jgi:hypothetical protein